MWSPSFCRSLSTQQQHNPGAYVLNKTFPKPRPELPPGASDPKGTSPELPTVSRAPAYATQTTFVDREYSCSNPSIPCCARVVLAASHSNHHILNLAVLRSLKTQDPCFMSGWTRILGHVHALIRKCSLLECCFTCVRRFSWHDAANAIQPCRLWHWPNWSLATDIIGNILVVYCSFTHVKRLFGILL